MTDTIIARTKIALAALDYFPPLICQSLLNKQSFRELYGLSINTAISLGTSGASVQRSELFEAVRSVLAGASKANASDNNNRVWCLTNEAEIDATPILILSSDKERLSLLNLTVLSNDMTLRIRSLEESASDVNLPTDDLEKWRHILTKRPLEDDEVEAFHSDLRDTPVHFEQSIGRELAHGKSTITSLVPDSRRYFRRLKGDYDGSNSISDYATGAGKTAIRHLSEWRPYEGFLFGLLLSSHSTLTAEIDTDSLDKDELVEAYEYVVNHGDVLSRLGAVEVGLRILPERPEVEPFLLRLVNHIRDDDLDSETSEFTLFSALFVLIDGELSRTRLMSEEPPFYRRLASLAHAALIQRQIVECEIGVDNFFRWAFDYRGEQFYMQSLVDMRTEPRWNPEFANGSQLQMECFGRIVTVGKKFENNFHPGELYETIFGKGKQSISNLCEFPQTYLPGPLDAAEDSPNPLPIELERAIKQQLDTDLVEPMSFFALVNSPMIFRITSSHAELAAKALRSSNHRLANMEDKSLLIGILNGIATVAAISRNQSLADELRILVRRYFHDAEYKLPIDEATRICLIASAARENLIEWRDFVGEWLTELAFSDLEKEDAEILHSRLMALLHAIPELWNSCAKADAALKALCSS